MSQLLLVGHEEEPCHLVLGQRPHLGVASIAAAGATLPVLVRALAGAVPGLLALAGTVPGVLALAGVPVRLPRVSSLAAILEDDHVPSATGMRAIAVG